MLVTVVSAQGRTNAGAEKVILGFIESYLNTDHKAMEKLILSDAYELLPRENKVLRISAADIIRQMKANGLVKQQCTSSYYTIAESEAMIVAKVDFHYDGHIVREFITLTRDRENEWKISEIKKFFVKTERPSELAAK